jgi:hypothetical protein
MATGAPTLAQSTAAAAIGAQPATPGVPIELSQSGDSEATLLWRQVDAILRRSLAKDQRAGEVASPLGTPVRQTYGGEWRTVAPGIVVSAEEYERRFGAFDLEAFRRGMSPEVFLAFVRHLGAIDGGDHTDVVRISATPDH